MERIVNKKKTRDGTRIEMKRTKTVSQSSATLILPIEAPDTTSRSVVAVEAAVSMTAMVNAKSSMWVTRKRKAARVKNSKRLMRRGLNTKCGSRIVIAVGREVAAVVVDVIDLTLEDPTLKVATIRKSKRLPMVMANSRQSLTVVVIEVDVVGVKIVVGMTIAVNAEARKVENAAADRPLVVAVAKSCSTGRKARAVKEAIRRSRVVVRRLTRVSTTKAQVASLVGRQPRSRESKLRMRSRFD